MAAEYIMHAGNPNVILCERGIRTFETATRNTLDLSAIPLIKRLSHLPVIADPSHGTGHRYLVQPMALAAAGTVGRTPVAHARRLRTTDGNARAGAGRRRSTARPPAERRQQRAAPGRHGVTSLLTSGARVVQPAPRVTGSISVNT